MKLPKIETLIIIIFFGAVCLWAITKCRSKQATLAAREKKYDDERPLRRDTVFVPQAPNVTSTPATNQTISSPAPSPLPAPTNPGRTPQNTPDNNNTPAPTTPAPSASVKYSTLYVAIEGLKIRKEPGLKGEVVAKLELYEPVSFLNQKTEWTQEISLGKEKVTDHWVKIRSQSGKEGWVFGAGVHYYKMKRKGVIE